MTNYHTTVLDHRGLLRLFRQVAGRKFVGPVDGINCVELVFEDADDRGGNLVSIFTEGLYRGQVAFGFVARELIESGYGTQRFDFGEAERR
jgi:hypothetical protein